MCRCFRAKGREPILAHADIAETAKEKFAKAEVY